MHARKPRRVGVGVPMCVARLAFCEKQIVAMTNTPMSFNDRQRAARVQRLRALLYSSDGIEPMKGGRGHDQVEWHFGKYPLVEVGDDNFSMFEGRKLPAGDLGEARTKLDGHD